MPTKAGKYIIFLIAVLAFFIPTLLIELNTLQRTNGELTFPWDSSFINIAVGKNLAFYGVWGLSKYAFQAACSSLLYPIVLVPFFFIGGAHLIIPLLVNGLAAAALLWFLQRELIRRGLPYVGQLAILLMVVFCLPMPLLIISGMEYTLFLLLLTLFATAIQRPVHWRLYLYAALLVATRYEGAVIAFIAAGFLLSRKQGRAALFLILASIVPILFFGLVSIRHGNAFIPPALLQIRSAEVYTAAIIGTILILGTIFIPLPYKKPWLACSVLGIIALVRTWEALGGIPDASSSVYHQQMEVAKFVHKYYNRWGISLNEIGATSYFSEGRKVDLTGVSNYAPERGKRGRVYLSPLVADSLSDWIGARVAILTGPQSGERPVGRWEKVASWNNANFYALDTSSGRRLKENLQAYEKVRPSAAQVRYY